ncbi:hypothetical protein DFH07DRAFT_940144 [Mycena maculata]|uniref:Uncharacterized protein n=1 Tax=Mycena maculata TaxID=230809 RepID=A0AAD7JBZ6_9AGAR|nr:hypothetical protein DFH07DRAFT_940144 [Mycena maculata]
MRVTKWHICAALEALEAKEGERVIGVNALVQPASLALRNTVLRKETHMGGQEVLCVHIRHWESGHGSEQVPVDWGWRRIQESGEGRRERHRTLKARAAGFRKSILPTAPLSVLALPIARPLSYSCPSSPELRTTTAMRGRGRGDRRKRLGCDGGRMRSSPCPGHPIPVSHEEERRVPRPAMCSHEQGAAPGTLRTRAKEGGAEKRSTIGKRLTDRVVAWALRLRRAPCSVRKGCAAVASSERGGWVGSRKAQLQKVTAENRSGGAQGAPPPVPPWIRVNPSAVRGLMGALGFGEGAHWVLKSELLRRAGHGYSRWEGLEHHKRVELDGKGIGTPHQKWWWGKSLECAIANGYNRTRRKKPLVYARDSQRDTEKGREGGKQGIGFSLPRAFSSPITGLPVSRSSLPARRSSSWRFTPPTRTDPASLFLSFAPSISTPSPQGRRLRPTKRTMRYTRPSSSDTAETRIHPSSLRPPPLGGAGSPPARAPRSLDRLSKFRREGGKGPAGTKGMKYDGADDAQENGGNARVYGDTIPRSSAPRESVHSRRRRPFKTGTIWQRVQPRHTRQPREERRDKIRGAVGLIVGSTGRYTGRTAVSVLWWHRFVRDSGIFEQWGKGQNLAKSCVLQERALEGS